MTTAALTEIRPHQLLIGDTLEVAPGCMVKVTEIRDMNYHMMAVKGTMNGKPVGGTIRYGSRIFIVSRGQ